MCGVRNKLVNGHGVYGQAKPGSHTEFVNTPEYRCCACRSCFFRPCNTGRRLPTRPFALCVFTSPNHPSGQMAETHIFKNTLPHRVSETSKTANKHRHRKTCEARVSFYSPPRGSLPVCKSFPTGHVPSSPTVPYLWGEASSIVVLS